MLVLAVIVAVIVIFILYCKFENKNLRTTNYLIEQDCVPREFEDTCFVCLTDLHENQFGADNKRLIHAIKKASPDYILIAGDMINGSTKRDVARVITLLEKLANEYPVYYAPGNHEMKWSMNDPESFSDFVVELTRVGVIYLDNDDVIIQKGNAQISVTGLNLPKEYFGKGRNVKPLTIRGMEELAGKATKDAYRILLAHMPEYFTTYAEWGADLVISGHIHGGIVRLPILGGVISPRYHLFPKYDAGKFTRGDHVMLLSRGLGTHTIKVRVFNPPELMRVVIKNKKQEN